MIGATPCCFEATGPKHRPKSNWEKKLMKKNVVSIMYSFSLSTDPN